VTELEASRRQALIANGHDRLEAEDGIAYAGLHLAAVLDVVVVRAGA
jgi:hypothetical protein